MIFDLRNCEKRLKSPLGQYLIDIKQLICVGRTQGQYVDERKGLKRGAGGLGLGTRGSGFGTRGVRPGGPGSYVRSLRSGFGRGWRGKLGIGGMALGASDSGAEWLRKTFRLLPTAYCFLPTALSRDQPPMIFSLAVHFCPRRPRGRVPGSATPFVQTGTGLSPPGCGHPQSRRNLNRHEAASRHRSSTV